MNSTEFYALIRCRAALRSSTPTCLSIVTPGGLLRLYDDVGVPATELRLPGADGQTPEVEIPRWLAVAPTYGLDVVGPPIPE